MPDEIDSDGHIGRVLRIARIVLDEKKQNCPDCEDTREVILARTVLAIGATPLPTSTPVVVEKFIADKTAYQRGWNDALKQAIIVAQRAKNWIDALPAIRTLYKD